METLFMTIRQGYKHGFPYGSTITLRDEHKKILARAKGGGYDMQGAIFRQWAADRFQVSLPDNADFMAVQDAIRPLGWRLRKVATTAALHVYELRQDGEEE